MIKVCEKWDTWCFRIIFVLFLASAGIKGYAAEQPNLKFDDASSFHEHVAVVAVGGKEGLIDVNGHFLVPAKYDYINDRSFYQGTVIVRTAGKYGLLSTAGKEIIPVKYEVIAHTDDGCQGLIYVKQGDKWGVYDTTGKEIVPNNYDRISIRANGLINVSLGEARGVLDERGHEIIPCTCKYDSINSDDIHDLDNIELSNAPRTGYSLVEKDNQRGVVDGNGKELIPVIYDQVIMRDNLILVQKDKKIGFINYQGQAVIPLKYDVKYPADHADKNSSASYFSEGLAGVATGGKWGYIDEQDRTVIPFIYDSGYPFRDGLAVVERNHKLGVINKNNTMILPLQYDYLSSVGEGLFDGTRLRERIWGIIDKTNKLVVPRGGPFSVVCSRNDQKILGFHVEQGRERFYIKNGDEFIPTTYETIGSFDNGLAPALAGNKWGYTDRQGQLIIPATYDDVDVFADGLAPVKVNYKWGYIDKQGQFTAWSYQ